MRAALAPSIDGRLDHGVWAQANVIDEEPKLDVTGL